MDDLLCLDAELQDDERMIRDSVAKFVTNDVIPQMPEAFEKAIFPEALIKQTAEPHQHQTNGAVATDIIFHAIAQTIANDIIIDGVEYDDRVIFHS